MSRRIKTSFTAGELAPELLGRSDLRAYENGARKLRNVVILPTGGLSRPSRSSASHSIASPRRTSPSQPPARPAASC